jgi:nucleoside-diphosphate kinase
MLKPDAYRRGLLGNVICRYEAKGLRLVGLKLLVAPRALMEENYKKDAGEEWFGEMIAFLCSGPVVPMVWEGESAIQAVDQLVGETDPLLSLPGTVRGDYALNTVETVVHRSRTPEEAARQIALWFGTDLLKEKPMAQDTVIPQDPISPGKNLGEQPTLPTGFDYQIAGQPEHLKQPFNPISGPPVMPSRAIHPIYPDKEAPY